MAMADVCGPDDEWEVPEWVSEGAWRAQPLRWAQPDASPGDDLQAEELRRAWEWQTRAPRWRTDLEQDSA
jgi:hypothetical protein